MWRLNTSNGLPERLTDESGATSSGEAGATEFNTHRFGNFLEVGKDKRSVKYTGNGAHGNDVGSIQGNLPVPPSQALYYFEVTVTDAGDREQIVIGFTDRGFKLGRHPGWEPNSYGYSGADGKKLHQSRVEDYAEPFSTGDTIGAGIHLARQELFFAKNGKHLGTAFRQVCQLPLYPTVGLHSKNETVTVNFGASPFLFNLEALKRNERDAHHQAVHSTAIPTEVPHEVVRDYLQHFGYGDTLRAFDDACSCAQADADVTMASPPASPPRAPEGNAHTLPHIRTHLSQSQNHHLAARQAVRQHIQAGAMDKAREQLMLGFGEILLESPSLAAAAAAAASPMREDSAHILRGMGPGASPRRESQNGNEQRGGHGIGLEAYFYFSCQRFIELIRQGRVAEAADYAMKHLSPLVGKLQHLSSEYDEMLYDVMNLICFENPEDCPVAALLEMGQREAVADVVNVQMLSLSMQQPRRCKQMSMLERLLKQLVAVQAIILEENGGLGERFRLRRHLRFPHQPFRQASKMLPARSTASPMSTDGPEVSPAHEQHRNGHSNSDSGHTALFAAWNER